MYLNAAHGIPKTIRCENNPFNSKEFHDFANSWGFDVVTSSPHYAPSNGLVEKAVGVAKAILNKSEGIQLGLLEYRNSSVAGLKYTPSQLLMSRVCKTRLPITSSLLYPSVVPKNVIEDKLKIQNSSEKCFDKHCRPKSPFKPEDPVLIKQNSIWVPGTVIENLDEPRSYKVQDHRGVNYRRTSYHLRPRENLKPPYRLTC